MDEVVITSDDSTSVHSSLFDATYHSRHGAIQESRYVFLNAGLHYYLNYRSLSTVKILEVGYGTGLNALLTAKYIDGKKVQCFYTGLEAYPISESTIMALNYGSILECQELFNMINHSEWAEENKITDNFFLIKKNVLLEKFETDLKYDIIYYDAFAPDIQPHLWEDDMMKKMHSLTRKGSILVTYCAKGSFRRTLEKVGFRVERIPGPKGKREMIRALRK